MDDTDSDLGHQSEAAEADDLRSVLAEAVAAHRDPAPQEPAPAKTAVERHRDDTGKFAPKPADKAPAASADPTPKPQAQTDTATPDGTASAATQKAPSSLPPALHNAFAAADPAIQAWAMKREAEVARGFQERAGKVQIADAFERAAAPYRETFARHGLDPLEGAKRMWAVEQELQRDPRGTILRIAQAYSVDPRTLLQPAAPNAPQTSQALAHRDPRVDQLAAYVAQQQQAEQRRQAEAHQAQLAQTNDEISRFASDPAHRHFEALKPAMSKLLSAGLAENLQDAYDKAAYADPAIREQLIAARTVPAQKAAQDQAAVARARAAAVSVKGAPVGPPKKAGSGSIRDAIREAMNET